MRRVKNALLTIIESTKRQHGPGNKKANIRCRDYQFWTLASRCETKFVHERFRFFQMLNDVEQEYLIELGNVHRELLSVQVPFDKVNISRPP